MVNINPVLYTNTKTETNSTKSYTDSDFGFDNLLDSANKAYEKKSNETEEIRPREKEKTENNIPGEKADKTEKNEPEKKTEEKEEPKDDSNTKEEPENNNDQDSKEDSVKTEENKPLENAIEKLSEIKNAAQDVIAAVIDKLAQTQQNQEQAKSTQKAQNADTKVQPQTQQVLLNIENIEISETSKTLQNTVNASKVAAETINIQANPDVKSEANAKLSKEELKEALNASGLSQDLLDKTNARVVSVETTSNQNENLLDRQNLQEQGIKLSLEATNNQNQQTSQTSFDKTINSLQQPKELNKTDVLAQIHTKLDQMKDDTTTKVTIVLKPENLGKVHLELVSGKDGISAMMTAENAQVKELLDKNLDGLKNSLGTQGVNVNNVTVKISETQAQQQQNDLFEHNQNEFEQNAKNQHNKNESDNNTAENETNEFSNANLGPEQDENDKLVHSGKIDYKI